MTKFLLLGAGALLFATTAVAQINDLSNIKSTITPPSAPPITHDAPDPRTGVNGADLRAVDQQNRLRKAAEDRMNAEDRARRETIADPAAAQNRFPQRHGIGQIEHGIQKPESNAPDPRTGVNGADLRAVDQQNRLRKAAEDRMNAEDRARRETLHLPSDPSTLAIDDTDEANRQARAERHRAHIQAQEERRQAEEEQRRQRAERHRARQAERNAQQSGNKKPGHPDTLTYGADGDGKSRD